MPASDRLFIGMFPTGISYADRQRERNGDYMRVAFLPFSTLELEWSPGRHPPELRKEVEKHAAAMMRRHGQAFRVDSAGHTVTLGSSSRKTAAQLDREIAALLGVQKTAGGAAYRVAYLVPNPRRGAHGEETMLRLWFAGDELRPMARAMADLRAARRRGYTAWITDEAGAHVPVQGATRPPPRHST